MNEALAREIIAEVKIRAQREKNRWRPSPGPQTLAYESLADELLYGGAAGGGKTDLVLGVAVKEHHRSIIFRRVYPSLKGIIDRSRAIYNPDRESALKDSYNESIHRWRFADGRQIEFGSIQYDKDKLDYQGQPHDLYAFDEVTEFTEEQVRYVTGWNRSVRPGQRCRMIATGNPPTMAEGEWVLKYWGPWLDDSFSNPAKPGELRWCTTVGGQDVWVVDSRPFVLSRPCDPDADRIYDFDPAHYKPVVSATGYRCPTCGASLSEHVQECPVCVLRPRSRTFIPAKVTDNRYLMNTGYVAKLQALPEPMRSKMLLGDWRAGREDNAYQIIPSEWVRLAQERWQKTTRPKVRMSMLGVDVARGGRDKTVLTPRYANWIGMQIVEPGKTTPDGFAVATLVIKHRDSKDTPVNIDVIGVGSSPFDCLRAQIGSAVLAMNGAMAAVDTAGNPTTDKSGQLTFVNKRAEWYWRAREELDPTSAQDMALPPDAELRSDLCAPRWKLTPRGIQVEAKDDIIKRIGRSPDKGDSYIYAVNESRGIMFAYESVKTPRALPIGNIRKLDDNEDDALRMPTRGGIFGGNRRRL